MMPFYFLKFVKLHSLLICLCILFEVNSGQSLDDSTGIHQSGVHARLESIKHRDLNGFSQKLYTRAPVYCSNRGGLDPRVTVTDKDHSIDCVGRMSVGRINGADCKSKGGATYLCDTGGAIYCVVSSISSQLFAVYYTKLLSWTTAKHLSDSRGRYGARIGRWRMLPVYMLEDL